MRKFYFAALGLLISGTMLNAQNQPFNSTLPPVDSEDFIVSDFEDMELDPESYWNGAGLEGYFLSGLAKFPNWHDTAWGTWDHWACSNTSDDTTAGFMNQYSAITAAGFEPENSGGATYGVAYVPTDWITSDQIPIAIKFADAYAHNVGGMYVTNGTYPYLSMLNGDAFSKKFGGESGNDPDFFKLTIWGLLDGTETDTIHFYLADYRFENNEEDYIVDSWEFIDLAGLGKVDSLMMTLSSSDTGMFGMNTPAFFCIDNLSILPMDAGISEAEVTIPVNPYPNPGNGIFRIDSGKENFDVSIFDMSGKIIFYKESYSSNSVLDIRHHPSGKYILKIRSGNINGSSIIFKN